MKFVWRRFTQRPGAPYKS